MSLLTRLTRRDWFQSAMFGVTGISASGWLGQLALASPAPKASTKSVIVLWLSGGPSTIDLWDLKPSHPNGGPFREIDTAATGVRISEHLPQLAKWTREMVLVRSLASREGDHGRATQYLQTGYLPLPGLQFPPLGALVAHENGREDADLPNFVSIAPSRTLIASGGGFLGPRYAPLAVGSESTSADDLRVPNLQRSREVSEATHHERLRILDELEREFTAGDSSPVVESFRTSVSRAARLMQSAPAAVFSLDGEPAKLRDAYGRNAFGQGCLLARRLVEQGVPFVEVTLGGWDTHTENFERVQTLSHLLDAAFSTLLSDLRDRGLLSSTLVVCQGEFGRTPKINGTTGRDHWPQSWAVALAGGSIQGGQVIGKTSADGSEVTDGKVTVPDLIATVCTAVGIDPTKQNASNVGRPIRVADPSARSIAGVL